MEERIKQILEYAIWAPSGDNSQPWKFKIIGNSLEIFLIPDADNIYLNYNLGGTLIAHGCLLENIKIASSNFGIRTNCEINKENSENLVATVTFFEDSNVTRDILFKFIKLRHTNRKNFFTNEIDENVYSGLSESVEEILSECPSVELSLIKDFQKRMVLGEAGANAEVVILENKELHSALFKDVNWSKKQELQKHSGLYINSMEFNPIQKFLFWLASHWTLMQFAIRVNFPKFIAKEDSVKYSTGACVGVISSGGNNWSDFINSGRVFQRFWLTATKFNLSVQPVIATLFLYKMINNNKLNVNLNKTHLRLIEDSYQNIRKIVSKDKEIHIMFRLGYSEGASGRSTRKDIRCSLM